MKKGHLLFRADAPLFMGLRIVSVKVLNRYDFF